MSGAAQRTEASGDPTLAGRTVLVIEDNADSRELLRLILRSLRAQVVVARDISEAERAAAFHRPHLIVCDMKLPDGTGMDFIGWLRAQPRVKSTPCMAITGFEQHFPANSATGFDAYMRKPISIDKFCSVAVALALP